MRAVHKQSLTGMENTLHMPSGARVLATHYQGEELMIWYECDPDAPLEDRFFAVRGTGHKWAETIRQNYIGTAFNPYGLVWHVYEII